MDNEIKALSTIEYIIQLKGETACIGGIWIPTTGKISLGGSKNEEFNILMVENKSQISPMGCAFVLTAWGAAVGHHLLYMSQFNRTIAEKVLTQFIGQIRQEFENYEK